MLKAILRLLVLTILLLPPMVFFPAICLTLALRPHRDAALACVFFGPLSAGFWVLIYSQLSSAPWWLGAEAVRQWKRDRGGLLVTAEKATCWMCFGIVASFFAEVAFMVAFKYVPYKAFDGEARLRLWLSLLPLACYFPLIPAWLWRRRHA
jgi:hypothetical protein